MRMKPFFLCFALDMKPLECSNPCLSDHDYFVFLLQVDLLEECGWKRLEEEESSHAFLKVCVFSVIGKMDGHIITINDTIFIMKTSVLPLNFTCWLHKYSLFAVYIFSLKRDHSKKMLSRKKKITFIAKKERIFCYLNIL